MFIGGCTGFSSEIGTKLRDWAAGQAEGQLLLSGSIVLKSLKDAVIGPNMPGSRSGRGCLLRRRLRPPS